MNIADVKIDNLEFLSLILLQYCSADYLICIGLNRNFILE